MRLRWGQVDSEKTQNFAGQIWNVKVGLVASGIKDMVVYAHDLQAVQCGIPHGFQLAAFITFFKALLLFPKSFFFF